MKIKDKILTMQGNHRGKDILVLTEDFADNIFWKRTLGKVITDKTLAFPNDIQGHTGEGYLNAYKPYVNEKFIICHDSDNAFLWTKKEPNAVPFIYETFVYSIENYSFDSNALNDLIYSMTNEDYDINKRFLETYTQYVADLFYWWCFFKKYGNEYGLSSNTVLTQLANTNADFKSYLSFNVENIETIDGFDEVLHSVYQNVEKYFELIEAEIGKEWYEAIVENEIRELKRQFEEEYLIEKSDIIYFLQGHSLEDIFTPFFKKLVSILKNNYIEELKRTVKNDSEGRIRTYQNTFNKDLETILNENYKYQLANPNKFFQKIIEAVERDFKIV